MGAGAAGLLAGGGGLVVGGLRDARSRYGQAVREQWHHAAGLPQRVADPLLEAIRYATLAASSHNTQCWRFRVRGSSVRILPDLRLRLPVVDPDDHHLFASIGCATENLLLAASALGLRGTEQAAGDARGTGSRWAAPASASRCRPRPSASGPRT